MGGFYMIDGDCGLPLGRRGDGVGPITLLPIQPPPGRVLFLAPGLRITFNLDTGPRYVLRPRPGERQRKWMLHNIPAFAAMQFELMRWRERVTAGRA